MVDEREGNVCIDKKKIGSQFFCRSSTQGRIVFSKKKEARLSFFSIKKNLLRNISGPVWIEAC